MSPRSRTVLLALTALCVVLIQPAPAAAHPFGPPLTAKLGVDGSRVTVTWAAAEDDWLNLGEHVGAFAAGPEMRTGEEKLQRSTPLRDYLRDHITVRQQGTECPGSDIELRRLLEVGALLTFDCASPVDTVHVTVSALSDVNPAYRTVVTAPPGASPGRALLTANAAEKEFTFGPESHGHGGRAVAVLAFLLTLAVTGAFVVTARTTRKRRTSE
jgi:hypothetical protein